MGIASSPEDTARASNPTASEFMETQVRDKLRVKRRNIPVHIIFWIFVIFLLYMFWKTFSGHTA